MKFQIGRATKTVLKDKSYIKGFFATTVLIYAAYILIPVLLVPGNDVAFQLSILQPFDFVLFLLISLITALLMVMQFYVHNRSKKKKTLASVSTGGVTLYSAIFGGLLATAACVSCIAGIVGFLGVGSTFFILDNRIPFVIGAFVIVLAGLYFVSKRVNEECESCEVKK